MENLQILAITHKQVPLTLIGKLHLDDASRQQTLTEIKTRLGLDEVAYLSTCNRVEFIFSLPTYFCKGRQNQLLDILGITGPDKAMLLNGMVAYRGQDAFRHLLEVGASLDSMVIGEREIITQVRKAFDEAREYGLSGDFLRIVARKVVETSKKVYHETAIATKPVSVVSLAWHAFKQYGIAKNEPILLVGAGQTNTNFARFLAKAGFKSVVVANRTLSRAESVASTGGWTACTLDNIPAQRFKAIVTCTGSNVPVVTYDMVREVADQRLHIIDMAIPSDVEDAVLRMADVHYVGMEVLQERANKNLEVRAGEIHACKVIVDDAVREFQELVREREIELAMRHIPEAIRAIRETAMGEVFAREIDQLDEASREVLERVLGYMEKKYISVPMKLAKQVILEKSVKN